MSNKFFIGILVVIAVVFGAIVLNGKKDNAGQNGDTNSSQGTPSNHTKGSDKTGVVLVEYGDFQCPACLAYYPVVKEVYEKYKDQITFQFRNFPLVQPHPNAMAAHRAAEAADKQGKFWEMHDMLFESQDQWASSSNASGFFENLAEGLGLDMTKYKEDVASAEVNSLINADMKEGQKIGASSTPTFVLDGVKIDNPRDLEDFNKVIEEAIAKKSQN